MKRTQKLDKIMALNSGFENMASQTLARCRQHHEQQRQQLERLLSYRCEYQQALAQRMQGSLSSREIHDYRAFLVSVEAAIEQQREVMERCESELEMARAQWLDRKREVNKVSRVAGRLRDQERVREERREGRELDELNQRPFARSSGSP